MTESLDSLRQTILAQALRRVPFEGWNQRTLEQAAQDALGDKTAADRAFPNSAADAVDLFLELNDRRMTEKLRTLDLPSMKIRQRVTVAVRSWLELLETDKEAMRRALAFLWLPQNAGLNLRTTWRTVDAMWHAAGDTTTDFNYYTKRWMLSKVFGSTLLFWLNDDHTDHEESWEFLDRRVENVMQFEKWKGQLINELSRWTMPFRPNDTKR